MPSAGLPTEKQSEFVSAKLKTCNKGVFIFDLPTVIGRFREGVKPTGHFMNITYW